MALLHAAHAARVQSTVQPCVRVMEDSERKSQAGAVSCQRATPVTNSSHSVLSRQGASTFTRPAAMVLVLAIHTVATVSATVPFAMIMLR